MYLIINKQFAVIATTKPKDAVIFMLINTLNKVACYTCVQRAVSFIHHNVNSRTFFHMCSYEWIIEWFTNSHSRSGSTMRDLKIFINLFFDDQRLNCW